MKSVTWLLFEFIQRFGIRDGARLFLKFKRGDIDKLRLPDLKSDISLRKDTADIETFFQVFLKNEYNINWLIEPKVIVDCGSHIGLFTVFMKNKFPDAKIICVEPDKENFDCLKKNTADYDNIFYENCGIWNTKTKLKLSDKYDLGNWAMVAEEDPLNGSVDAISIDHLMKKHQIERIDILKLDIESSEKQVFEKDYSQWLPKTKIVSVELHDWMTEGCSKPFFQAINKTFESYSYLSRAENTVIFNNDLK